MKRKPSPKFACHYCGRLWYHIADAFNCADLDVKEDTTLRLKLITDNKELKILTKSNKIS